MIKEIVKTAGKMMLNGDFTVHDKAGMANFVTDNDVRIQKYLIRELEKIYPDCAPTIEMGVASSSEFTEAELDVLHLLVGGDTDQEIADKLHVSVWTVRTHIKDLLQKTGYKNRVELAVKARSNGVVADI